MKKYTFLVYHREYLEFLRGLQDLGMLHVIEKESGDIEDEEVREKYQQVTDLNNAIKFLEKFEVEESPDSRKDGLAILSEINRLHHDVESYHQRLAHLQKEQNTLLPWGDFSWETVENLNKAGYFIDFYINPLRSFKEEWLSDYDIEEINDDGGIKYFVHIHKEDEEIDIDAEKVKLPKTSLNKLEKAIAEVEAILEKAQQMYLGHAEKHLKLLRDTKVQLQNELNFNKVVLSTEKQADQKLMVLEGWVPNDSIQEVEAFLEKAGAYYESSRPDPDTETPPIKLKNGKFSRLFESIGELYTFPDYRELDLTPFFAPFYMLFFGFCLGDAGYGLLITAGTIIGLMKAPPKIKPLLRLGMFLGISTTIMGIIGGTFFGIMLHPDDFKSARELAPWLQKYQTWVVSSKNLMYASLGIGYIQVVFGMFLNAANRAKIYGFKYAISQLGWNIIVLVSLPAFVLGYFNLVSQQPAYMVAMISGIVGGLPAFFYNTPGKNPLLNFGTGLWNTYQVASGLLGDILSYIRLFALGLSSAILGNVFNQLALDSSQGVGGGVVGALIMILILAFGHSLNFFMAALGSFVHPLRLTFVEFYKNAGFAGGGRKYEPFRN